MKLIKFPSKGNLPASQGAFWTNRDTLPILIATVEPSDEAGTFFPANTAFVSGPGEEERREKERNGNVLVVTNRHVDEWLEKMDERIRATFDGVSDLKRGLDRGDALALEMGYEKLRAAGRRDLVPTDGLAQVFLTQNKKAAKKVIATYDYSRLLSRLLRGARLVMWYSYVESRWTPALYCPDRETAVFAMRLLGRIRVCAYAGCRDIFVPQSTDQDCCKTEHATAYRKARSRHNQKNSPKE